MEEKKIVKKNVTFSPTDEKHTMVHWSFAYREARKGTWHLFAIDRCRFKRRISQFEEKLKPHLTKRIQEAQVMNYTKPSRLPSTTTPVQHLLAPIYREGLVLNKRVIFFGRRRDFIHDTLFRTTPCKR